MKAVAISFIIAATAMVASAQSSDSDKAPPNVKVLSHKWSKAVIFQVPFRPDDYVTPPPSRSSPPPSQPRTLESIEYVYEAKVRNTGDRDIRAMRWDYVFTDPGRAGEVDRFSFYSAVTIHPNREKTLEGHTRFAPTATVSATGAPSERVDIECVTLSDGSTWRLPSFKGSCRSAKSSKPSTH